MSISSLALLVGLFSLSWAQNNTTNLSRCPNTVGVLSPNARVNSTGMRSFRWQDEEQDWYLTSTLNDTRDPILVSSLHHSQGYLSAPIDTDAKVCVFMFGGVNATTSGDDGCEGILSQDCINFLRQNATFPSTTGRCTPPAREDIIQACGRQVSGSGYSSQPIDFAIRNCSILSPPANSVPSDYLTWPAMAEDDSPNGADVEYDSFVYYDRYVRQPRPWVFAREGKETQVLCLAPDVVLEGSRTPEGEWPPAGSSSELSGAGRERVGMMGLVLGVVGTIILM